MNWKKIPQSLIRFREKLKRFIEVAEGETRLSFFKIVKMFVLKALSEVVKSSSLFPPREAHSQKLSETKAMQQQSVGSLAWL
jgi:hypothetical protein